MSKIGLSGVCYVAVTVLGTLFALTACSYGAMAVRASRGLDVGAASGLMRLMDERGPWILVGELVGLGLATVGAIVIDSRQGRRNVQSAGENSPDGRP